MKNLYAVSGAAIAAVIAFGLAVSASAADMALKAVPPAAVLQSYGFYAWLDGSWENVHLPRYDLGFRNQALGAPVTPALSFDPVADGYGISGGVGWLLPLNLGMRDRFEISGRYVRATDSGSGSSSGTGSGGLTSLSGNLLVNTGCGALCLYHGTLSSSYTSWQVSGRFATDYKTGVIIITPSLTVFGGHSRDGQNLMQTLGFSGSNNVNNYSAQTALGWTDWGARAGLSGTIPLTNWMSFTGGGSLGVAARNASLQGSDSSFLNFGGTILFPSASTIGQNASTSVFLANAEGSLNFTPASNWMLRVFAGLNYDNRVPGVAAGVLNGNLFGGAPFVSAATAASIKYEAETSFYAGGGVSVKF